MNFLPGALPLDIWTLIHVLAGVILGATGLSTRAATIALVLWEGFEVVMRSAHGPGGSGAFEYESLWNIASDIAVGVLGFFAGRFLVRKAEGSNA